MFDKRGFYILSFSGMSKDQLMTIENKLKEHNISCICIDKGFTVTRLDT